MELSSEPSVETESNRPDKKAGGRVGVGGTADFTVVKDVNRHLTGPKVQAAIVCFCVCPEQRQIAPKAMAT